MCVNWLLEGLKMNENREYCKRIAEELTAIYNGEVLNDDGDTMTLYDYFSDVLDFEYTITSKREYKSVKAWITLGGPNVWIDTNTASIRLAWGADREEYPLDYEVNREIDFIFEEYFNC
jgi:hypothetical protein